jgi:hypothetical protein
MVESYDRSARRLLDFTLGINMAGLASCRQTKNKEADPSDRPQKEEKGYVTEDQVRHARNQRLTSSDLLKKYEYQYQQRLRRESKEEEYERCTGKRLKKHEDAHDHWHYPFFRYCWDSGMSRLPTTRDCPECGPVKPDAKGVWFSNVWDLFQLSKSRFDHHKGEWTLMKKKTRIVIRDGALMDSIILRSTEFSGCAVWKKPRLDISSH